ncbi:MAG: DNA repair protein RecO, partial [Hydrogenophaga sp.]|nr:DNA repair protein RecO [Hydrogenophaga sp.]
MATRRFSEEPAFVLHRYDWSESSLVLEVFTRHHGRIALVAKGVKRPTSQFRPVLLPLQPLHLSWGGDAEVRTLKSAQWQGGHVMPTGEALLSGCYLNELLMRLLARDDPHAALYDHYTLAVQLLAERADAQQLILRAFELLLLRDIGLLSDLAHEGNTLAALQDGVFYVLGPESGLRAAHEDDAHALSGAQWRSLQIAL